MELTATGYHAFVSLTPLKDLQFAYAAAGGRRFYCYINSSAIS